MYANIYILSDAQRAEPQHRVSHPKFVINPHSIGHWFLHRHFFYQLRYFGSFVWILWSFRALFGILFWLNPFEFLVHLKKHQHLFIDSDPKYDGWCWYMWVIPFLNSLNCWTLPALKSLGLFENSILALLFAKYVIKFSTLCSLFHRNLVLAVTVLLLLVLVLAKSSSESHVYLWKSTHANAKIIFNPRLKFQLGLRKSGWNAKCNTKIKTVDFRDIMEWNISPDTTSKFQHRAEIFHVMSPLVIVTKFHF